MAAFPDRSICRAAKVVYPTTEEELILAVANATMANTKMKVATRTSHSIPKLVCPEGDNGLLISTKYLNRTLDVNVSSMTMTVESGMTLRELINDAAEAKLALPYAPYWWGLTIGGMMGTAEEGYAKVRTLEIGNPELNAAKVSLGVLGVISQVTFKLQPMFKRSVTYITKNDSDFGAEAISFGRKHEYADFMWYPSQKQVVYRIDDRVPSNTSGNGLLDFPGFRSTASLVVSGLRTTEETEESQGDANGKCINGKATTFTLKTMAFGLTNNGILFTGYPVVGYHNRLQASGTCLDSLEDLTITACPWDHRVKGLFFHQTTFSISLSKVKNFIEDVQKLVALEPKSMCVLDLYNGILIRYVTASTAYLGKQEDALDFDITYYRSKDPMSPRLYEDILEEIEQIAMFKYGALPHWGKNRNLAFDGVINKYKSGIEFLKVKAKYDPLGLFSSSWTDQILGLNGVETVDKEGCALEGLCICSQDIHCAPKKNYFCRPGKVYRDARVCTSVYTN
ncbi:putative L-gulonolactone oxidase 6 [Forsythia ovata]|uniref:L-gulonolactone oxidase n=1 Tax=Forsythia ovata TaxID=205694 RepID=A0ABD1QS96_9LAMI